MNVSTAARNALLLCMALLALVLAARVGVDIVRTVNDDRPMDRTSIPTVYVPNPDRGIDSLNPRPHLLRDA